METVASTSRILVGHTCLHDSISITCCQRQYSLDRLTGIKLNLLQSVDDPRSIIHSALIIRWTAGVTPPLINLCRFYEFLDETICLYYYYSDSHSEWATTYSPFATNSIFSSTHWSDHGDLNPVVSKVMLERAASSSRTLIRDNGSIDLNVGVSRSVDVLSSSHTLGDGTSPSTSSSSLFGPYDSITESLSLAMLLSEAGRQVMLAVQNEARDETETSVLSSKSI